MIAMARLCGPRLLLCDEPTTALDVTVQLQVLKLLESCATTPAPRWSSSPTTSRVVNQTCSELAVMYAGHIVEAGRVKEASASRGTPTPAGCWSRRRTSTARSAS